MLNEIKKYALDGFINEKESSVISPQGLEINIRAEINFLNIRGSINDSDFIEHAEAVFQQTLPLDFNTFSVGEHHIYWLAPDEWLVCTAHDLKPIVQNISPKIDLYVTSQTGGYTQLILQGDSVRSLLSKGCTLDISEKKFLIGQCAQTGLGKAGILLALTDSSPTFNIIVRRSFAEYVGLWLKQCGNEFGVNFTHKH